MSRDDQLAFPELLHGPYQGGSWTVLECSAGQSRTDPSNRKMYVPKMLVQEDMLVVMHELRHVRRAALHGHRAMFTGQTMRDVFRRMAEEIAVEQDAAADGTPIYRARDHLGYDSHPVPLLPWQKMTEFLQYGGSVPFSRSKSLRDYWQRLNQEMPPGDVQFGTQVIRSIQADTSHINCERWADELNARYSPPVEEPEKPEESDAAEEAKDEAEQEEAEEEAAWEQMERDQGLSGTNTPGADARTSGGLLDIHVHTHSSTASKVIAAQWRSSQDGTNIRYPSRLYPDGRIFGVKQRAGSLLVDVSGSMGWEQSSLEAAIKRLPGLWVAAYSGHGTSSKYVGRLCIVAQKGRLSEKGNENEMSGGNYESGADLAALEFSLRVAPKPFIWVSDGETGYSWYQLVNDLCTKMRVPRVLTLQQGIDYLMGKEVTGYIGAEDTKRRTIRQGRL